MNVGIRRPSGTWMHGAIDTRHVRGALQIPHPFGAKMPRLQQMYFDSLPRPLTHAAKTLRISGA
jgi:hypothetical protein